MAEMEKMDDLELESVAGGVKAEEVWKWVKANVNNGYLSLVSNPSGNVGGVGGELKKIVDGTAFRILPDKIVGNFVYAVFDGEEGWVKTDGILGFFGRK